jgi:hypothetical protein
MLDLNDPNVKLFHRAAAAHLDAAESLIDACSERSVSTRAQDAVYLAGYVVECGIKALLLSVTRRKDRKSMLEWFRAEAKHKLDVLRSELGRKGVEIPRKTINDFTRVRGVWSSEMR